MSDINQNFVANPPNPAYSNDQQYYNNYPPVTDATAFQRIASTKQNNIAQIFAIVLSVLVVVSGIVGGIYFYNKTNTQQNSSQDSKVLGTQDATKWNAIFLLNGQVYFGKILEKTQNEMILDDVYFLNVVQRPVGSAEGDQAQVQAEPELTLIQRTNTLHKPTGKIILNMANVLFTEELTADSQVIEAIEAMKNSPQE